ncbi:hypothetical protein CALVIDRAFT_558449 [Calocera viscosa TUFC12733]|uniref:SGNH hydrolase n=1 Tax=Calocera viscosa (strain TUFC12733) TaxID=1330018 RepID=A0A167GRG3_CALVF|nr:hypothetical protein CALVIDRAFT_558449 [Calocera viscosa TUFC12733]
MTVLSSLRQRPVRTFLLVWTALALCSLVFLEPSQLFYAADGTLLFPSFPSLPEPQPPCEPYTKPGTLHLNPDQPHLTTYTPFDASCQPNNTLLQHWRDGVPVDEFRNTSVLLLGDSVDRGWVNYTCTAGKDAGAVLRMSALNDSLSTRPKNENGGNPRTCAHGALGLEVSFYHFCGLTDADIWRDKPDPCNRPGPFHERWKLFLRWASSLDKPPDIVVIQSGLWDLAAFDRNLYLTMDHDTDLKGLTDEFIASWIGNMTDMVHRVKEAFPRTSIYYRIVHQTKKNGDTWFRPTGNYKTKHGKAFRPLRVQQVQDAQKYVVEQEQLHLLPFGDLVGGQLDAVLQDAIHPNDVGNALLTKMVLEALWRERQTIIG